MSNKIVYTNSNLVYPLTQEEFSLIDKVWEFNNLFHQPYYFITDYRKNLINTIQKKYNANEFLQYEDILNKIFWNLMHTMVPYWTDEKTKNGGIPSSLRMCKCYEWGNENQLQKLIDSVDVWNEQYYRSFINKIILIDRQRKLLFTKPFEGSSEIFTQNYFNLLGMRILADRNNYEKVMSNPDILKNDQFMTPLVGKSHYYQRDYGFPNLNYCTYRFANEKERLRRIKRMFFFENGREKWWFLLMRDLPDEQKNDPNYF